MRVAGWQSRLIETFESAHGRRFRWGRHDCCQFAARCIEAVTGEDRRGIFPSYRTKVEALRILDETGGMRGLLTRALGEPTHPARAGEGDIVLVDFGLGEQPAVCMGVKSYAPGFRNLQSRDTLSALAAWVL